jgi:hypothetical protein
VVLNYIISSSEVGTIYVVTVLEELFHVRLVAAIPVTVALTFVVEMVNVTDACVSPVEPGKIR